MNYLQRKFHNFISDKKFSEIFTGSIWAMGARVFSTVIGLVTSVFIARLYGAEVVGILAVVNSFLMFSTIFTVLGTGTSILRLIPEHLVKYSPTSAFLMYRKTQLIVIGVSLLISTLFFFVAHLIANNVFGKPSFSFYFSLAAVFIVFKSLMILNTQAVRGIRLVKVFAFIQVLPSVVNLLVLFCLFAFLASKDDPVYALLASMAVTAVVGWVIMEVSFKRRMSPSDHVEPMSASSILSVSFPMLMTNTMNFAIAQTGVIMLGVYRTEAEVGYYSIAVKLATLTSFILTASNSMIAPKFSDLFHSGKMDELFYIAKKSSKFIFWATVPVLLGLVFFGYPLLKYFFGTNFAAAYPAMTLLIVGQFVNSVSGSTGMFMNMVGYQRQFSAIIIFSSSINILFCYLFIPDFGVIGAAVSSVVSIIFWNIATLLYIKIKHGQSIGYIPMPDFFRINF